MCSGDNLIASYILGDECWLDLELFPPASVSDTRALRLSPCCGDLDYPSRQSYNNDFHLSPLAWVEGRAQHGNGKVFGGEGKHQAWHVPS